MLEACIHQFLERLKKNRSLKPLYRNADFCVALEGKNSRFLIAIDKEGCRLLPNEAKADVMISGKEKDLIHLLEGKERLLSMMQRQALTAKGTYRRLLKVESLFLLNGTERFLIYQLS
ncbi:MAG TPA: SCP2 sterol-binding domain-containing protein [Bacillales bacterium]|nr:SCP2 sterol-binding domain-containing protein [Bacillales bacterium]